MKKIWAIFLADFKAVAHNTIALVVCVGLVILPSLYAWLNIEGSWDPYGHTNEIKIAVANNDAGYQSDLIPVCVNIGERMVSKLSESTTIHYVITSKEDAEHGVQSGAYYAALLIPENFSQELLTSLSGQENGASITYLSNQKLGAIAPIVTDKAAESARTEIERSFAESVTEVGAGLIGELTNNADDSNISSAVTKLDETLVRGSKELRIAANHIGVYQGLVDSAQQIIESTSDLSSSSSNTLSSAQETLLQAADGTQHMNDAAISATQAVDGALAQTSASFDTLNTSINDALDNASTTAGHAASNIQDAASRIEQVKSGYESLLTSLQSVKEALPANLQGLLDAPIARLQGSIATLQNLQDELTNAAQSINDGISVSTTQRAQINALPSQASSDLSTTRSDLQTALKTSLTSISTSLTDVSNATSTLSESLTQTLQDIQNVANSTANNLSVFSSTLSKSKNQLTNLADKLDLIHAQLSEALSSKDIKTVRQILSASSSDLAEFIAAPTTLKRTAVYPIENNGSAMAGFYTTLSLWVGGIILVAMLNTGITESLLKKTDAKPRHAYLGRLLTFSVLGFLQSTLVGLGDLFYLQIQYVDPVRFMISVWFTSLVFVNIMYAFTYAFGDIGKAICVFLLVIQVAGAGGSFPVQMLPESFQVINPLLPFVHAIAAMHENIAGYYGNVWISELGALSIFLAASLMLGLVLRKPTAKLNAWIIEKLEDTKIM